MVQQLRQNQPQYSCIIPIDRITGNQDEEIVTFGVSAEDAKHQAEQLLANTYGCDDAEIRQLLQQARIEPLGYWCAASDRQD